MCHTFEVAGWIAFRIHLSKYNRANRNEQEPHFWFAKIPLLSKGIDDNLQAKDYHGSGSDDIENIICSFLGENETHVISNQGVDGQERGDLSWADTRCLQMLKIGGLRALWVNIELWTAIDQTLRLRRAKGWNLPPAARKTM